MCRARCRRARCTSLRTASRRSRDRHTHAMTPPASLQVPWPEQLSRTHVSSGRSARRAVVTRRAGLAERAAEAAVASAGHVPSRSPGSHAPWREQSYAPHAALRTHSTSPDRTDTRRRTPRSRRRRSRARTRTRRRRPRSSHAPCLPHVVSGTPRRRGTRSRTVIAPGSRARGGETSSSSTAGGASTIPTSPSSERGGSPERTRRTARPSSRPRTRTRRALRPRRARTRRACCTRAGDRRGRCRP